MAALHRSTLKKKIDDLEAGIRVKTGRSKKTAIGVVHPNGHLLRVIKNINGKYEEVDEDPQAYIAEKIEPIFTRPKRFMVLIGGRGSTKSIAAGDLALIDMHDNGDSWLFLREFQSSIADSVHELLKSEISRIGLDGFDITDKTIKSDSGGKARFNGLSRNPESVKSAFGFKGFMVEEAQFLSEKSLRVLTPTGRNKPINCLPADYVVEEEDDALSNVVQLFCGNPGSSQDPFSQRFLVPFQSSLDKYGFYEDDLHLIIKINYMDNPWFRLSGLESERNFDYNNLPRAMYDHIWLGDYNDSVANAIIEPEWFDACIDAHLKLGFTPSGVKFFAHDPSDVGDDEKAFAYRHGSVFLDVQSVDDYDVNEGCDWALDYAIDVKADNFSWDVGGMGISLKRQVGQSLEGKRISATMFNGAEEPEMPNAIYDPNDKTVFKKPKTNKEAFFNKRAQCYWKLRDRVYNTYRAVTKGEYINPDELISFSSNIESLDKLRSEICRIPKKPNGNGKIQIMTKDEMRKMGIPSPNMADSVMMTMTDFSVIKKAPKTHTPPQKKIYRR